MLRKLVSNSNVSITSKGAIYVDVNKLFDNQNVKDTIEEMADFETDNESQSSENSSEVNKNAN